MAQGERIAQGEPDARNEGLDAAGGSGSGGDNEGDMEETLTGVREGATRGGRGRTSLRPSAQQRAPAPP
jgi:hypothetical protein